MIEKRNNSNLINLGSKVKPFAIENAISKVCKGFDYEVTYYYTDSDS